MTMNSEATEHAEQQQLASAVNTLVTYAIGARVAERDLLEQVGSVYRVQLEHQAELHRSTFERLQKLRKQSEDDDREAEADQQTIDALERDASLVVRPGETVHYEQKAPYTTPELSELDSPATSESEPRDVAAERRSRLEARRPETAPPPSSDAADTSGAPAPEWRPPR